MALSVAGVSTLRDFVVADVNTAWTPTRIHVSAPELETDETSALPVALVVQQPLSFDSEQGGVNAPGAKVTFDIRGRFAKPENAALDTLKDAKADALLALLTASWKYHDAIYFAEEIIYSPSPDESDAARGWYEVGLTMTFHL